MMVRNNNPKTAKRRFELIAFDWDGTLFDSTGIIVRCIQKAVRDTGGTPPSNKDAAWVIGMGLMQALAHAAPDVPPEKHQELGEHYRRHYSQCQHDIALFDGVLPMLHDLRARGYKLAVATGKSRRGLDEVLDHVELRGMFDSTRTADQTAGKPHPLMLQELMAELEASPEQTLMVGDTIHDLQMASNAGCPSVAVSYGAHAPETFAELSPLFVANTAAELHAWLRTNG